MGFYSRVIFPRICELVLNRPFIARRRRELLAHTHGNVLEIGFGTGLNLPHYPERIRKITTVEPNEGMHRLARRRVMKTGIEIDQRVLSSEHLPFEDCTFDCVVSTFTLCSIENVSQALAEVHRVLKVGGSLHLLEHGLSPDPSVQKWQRRLNWLEKLLADGCRLDRNIRELIVVQPFSLVDIDEFYLENIPKTHGYVFRGTATK